MSNEQTQRTNQAENKNDKPSIWHDPKLGSIVALVLVIVFASWLWLSHSMTRDAMVDWIRNLVAGNRWP